MTITYELTTAQRDALEALIDASTLGSVVAALSEIAAEKADHIRVNWQDAQAARPWERASNALYTASTKIDI